MTLDPTGANVASTAAIVVLVGAIIFVVGGSPLGRVLGFRTDAPLLFNPTGARVIGLLMGYPAVLVAVWGLTYGVIAPLAETTALPVQGGFAVAAGVLVLTGARFAKFLTFQVGGRTAVEGELRPDEIVPVDRIGDDLDLSAAVEAARRGEWYPGAALLAATGDADVRADRIRRLTELSVIDSQWIEEWFAAAPDDVRVTVVRAELAVQRAWAARGDADGAHTSEEAVQAFFTGLDQAQRLAERAIEQAPDDPTPWATLVQIARGQQVPPEEFERRVQGLFERAPHHVYGSQVALQYACAKWFGSTETMFAMARDLGAGAPDGSATCLLPLIAHIEHHLDLESGIGGPSRAQKHMTAGATRTELRTCVARWMGGPDGGPQPGGRLEGHNLAAYAFWLADDPDAARPHLEAIGRGVFDWPWGYSGTPGEVLGVARRWAGLPVVAPVGAGYGRAREPFSPA